MAADAPIDRSVLVTGAGGYLGRQLVEALAAAGVGTIVAVDVREVPVEGRVAGVVHRTLDVHDPGLADLLREHAVDAVVHLAAIVNPRGIPRELAHSIDVLGTKNVLQACLAADVRQLVVTSSGAAYGYHADNPVPVGRGRRPPREPRVRLRRPQAPGRGAARVGPGRSTRSSTSWCSDPAPSSATRPGTRSPTSSRSASCSASPAPTPPSRSSGIATSSPASSRASSTGRRASSTWPVTA